MEDVGVCGSELEWEGGCERREENAGLNCSKIEEKHLTHAETSFRTTSPSPSVPLLSVLMSGGRGHSSSPGRKWCLHLEVTMETERHRKRNPVASRIWGLTGWGREVRQRYQRGFRFVLG